MINNLIRIMCVSTIILICLPTSDVVKEYPSYFRSLGFALLGFLFILQIKIRGVNNLKSLRNTFVWIGLLFCCFIPSSISNGTFEVFVFFLTISVLYFIIIPNTPIKLIDLALSSSILNAYIAYRCFYEMDVWYAIFPGTSTNSNQFALIIVGGVIGSNYLFVKKKSLLWRIYALTTLVVGVVLIAFSSSRTVMVTTSAIMLYTVIFLVDNSGKKISRKFLFALILMALSLLIFRFYDAIDNFLFNKWEDTTSSNLTSGRVDIWLKALMNATLGGDFNSKVNANSEYFNYLILYGILPFIVYIFICIISLKRTYLFHKKEKSSESLFCLYIIIAFLFMSLFENFYSAFGQIINIMFWYVVSITLNSKGSTKKYHHMIDYN